MENIYLNGNEKLFLAALKKYPQQKLAGLIGKLGESEYKINLKNFGGKELRDIIPLYSGEDYVLGKTMTDVDSFCLIAFPVPTRQEDYFYEIITA